MIARALALSLLVAAPAYAETYERERAGATSTMNAAREAPDACGGRGMLDAIVPDGPFLEACKHHDACYRSDAMDQGRCDRDFLADMRAACRTAYPAATKQVSHTACQVAAFTYFRAVNSRFGAHEYGLGSTGGELLSHWQQIDTESDGKQELTLCTSVLNPSHRKLHYRLALETLKGKRIDLSPDIGTLALQPAATGNLCVSTNLVPLVDAASLGERYIVVLEMDDPDRLTLGDQIVTDRLTCTAASGECVHAAP